MSTQETQLSSEANLKPETSLDKKLPLMELFGPTIQGEGAVIGQQTFFLRFGLCDYKCTMCDSMHAVDGALVSENAMWLTQKEIAHKFFAFTKSHQTNWITFSGGNPAIHDLSTLVVTLKNRGFRIAVETQGTFAPNWLKHCNLVTCSPKGPGMGERFDEPTFLKFIHHVSHQRLAIKIVIFGQPDIDFAARIVDILHKHRFPISNVYLSQGNPFPPGAPDQLLAASEMSLVDHLRQEYLGTFERLKNHKTLSHCKFLPQWHVWLWQNDRGR